MASTAKAQPTSRHSAPGMANAMRQSMYFTRKPVVTAETVSVAPDAVIVVDVTVCDTLRRVRHVDSTLDEQSTEVMLTVRWFDEEGDARICAVAPSLVTETPHDLGPIVTGLLLASTIVAANYVPASDNATVIGRVSMAEGASVWYGAVLRGDNEPITIGEVVKLKSKVMGEEPEAIVRALAKWREALDLLAAVRPAQAAKVKTVTDSPRTTAARSTPASGLR